MLKVDDVRLDFGQESLEGGLHVSIEERIKKECRGICLSDVKRSPYAPSSEALALFPLFTEGASVAIISVKHKDLMVFGQGLCQVMRVCLCSTQAGRREFVYDQCDSQVSTSLQDSVVIMRTKQFGCVVFLATCCKVYFWFVCAP